MSFRRVFAECLAVSFCVSVVGVFSPQYASAASRTDYEITSKGNGFSVSIPLPYSLQRVGARASGSVPLQSNHVTCVGNYDYPHASKSSNYSAVNAHVIVECRGSLDYNIKIKVVSTMHAGFRSGKPSTATGKKKVRVGSDLRCANHTEVFQASGFAEIWYPPPYARTYDKYSVRSAPVRFKRARNGTCQRVY